MKDPLLVVFTYEGQNEMLDRHWKGYEKHFGEHILLSFPTDAPCPRGGVCFNKSQHYGKELMERIYKTLRLVTMMPYDMIYCIEGDSIILSKPPEILSSGLHCFLWNNTENRFKAKHYPHWPWAANKPTLSAIVQLMRFRLEEEEGFPDRQMGLICEDNEIPMIHRSDICYSRNRLDRPEYIEEAREAIKNGAMFIHGIKTKEEFDAVIK
jgi:hypothetical protein